MNLCNLSCICNFGIFDLIFTKFSPKCRPKKLRTIYDIWEVLILKGSLFGPKSGIGKSLINIMYKLYNMDNVFISLQNNQLLLIDDIYTKESIAAGGVPGIASVTESVDKEKQQTTTIEISQDISAKTFAHVLEFLYSGICLTYFSFSFHKHYLY